jgi:WD40 repeat protein
MKHNRIGGWFLACLELTVVGLVVASPLSAQESKLRDTLKGHRCGVHCLAYSPDGKTLASGSYREVKLWDVETGKLKATLEGEGYFCSLAYSPDGETLVGTGPMAFKLWDVKTGKERTTTFKEWWGEYSATFPNPRSLPARLPSRESEVKFQQEVKTRKVQATLKGHRDSVADVAFSPDGKTLASGSYDKTIKLWNVATGKELATLIEDWDPVHCVAFSPDGKTLAAAVLTSFTGI